MSYIRTKKISGNFYYYQVTSVRVGEKVKQQHVRYIGKSLADVSRMGEYLRENKMNKVNLRNVPDKGGIYYIYNSQKKLIFIGNAMSLKADISDHYHNKDIISRNAHYFLYRSTKTSNDATKMYIEEVEKYKPIHNRTTD